MKESFMISYGSGMTSPIILNKELKDIMRIVKPLEKESLLLEGVSNTIEKGGLPSMVLGTLTTSLLENVLVGKAKLPGRRVIRVG